MRINVPLILTAAVVLTLTACFSVGAASPVSTTTAAKSAAAAPKQPGHIFIVMLENEGYDTTFGAGSAAPYLSSVLPTQGALLTNYYGIGHNSLDNYIALVSGQAPNPQTQSDCYYFTDWLGETAPDSNGQVLGAGCVLPPNVFSVANQLQASGLSWRGYMEDMGNDAMRDGGTACAHPALNAAFALRFLDE